MKISRVLFLYEGRTNSVFRDPLLAVPPSLRSLGVECIGIDIRHAQVDELGHVARNFRADIIFQITRSPVTAWKIARAKAMFTVPLVLWNFEEPNMTFQRDLLGLAELVDLYITLDARMCRWHKRSVMHLPLFFDSEIYQEYHLPRDLSASFLGQFSTPRLRAYLRPLVAVLEKTEGAFVSTYRPMRGWGGSGYKICATLLDHMPLTVAAITSLVAQRSGIWKQDQSIRPHGFFINRDEEEKSFIYGRSQIGVGFSRVFGPWEPKLAEMLPDYEKDTHGNYVQLKSRQFEIAGAGAMLLSDASPDLDALFTPNVEYIPYDYTAVADFRDKLRFYTENATAREKIAKAGNRRANQDHTLRQRMITVIHDWKTRW